MRTTATLELLRRGVHPASLRLGYPFLFVPGMWEESKQGQGRVYADDDTSGCGIVVASDNGEGDYTQIQRIHAVQPQAGKLITFAARIFPEHLDNISFRAGLWSAGGSFSNGVFFQQDNANPDPPPKIYGRAITDAGDVNTGGLFDMTNHYAVDVAIVIRGTDFADFIWERSHLFGADAGETEGTWGSAVLAENIPTVPLRPAFYVQRPGASVASLTIRGFVLRETTLRE